MKTVFIISGFNTQRTAASPAYKDFRALLSRPGVKVVPVDINWRHKTISQFVDEFIDYYNHHKGEENIIIGNSFGAVVAFLSAVTLQPNKIILCSLSPFFSEDIKTNEFYEYSIRKFGKRRLKDLIHYSADAVAAEISKTNIEIVMAYGEQEIKHVPYLVERVKDTAAKIKRAKLVEIPSAPHSLRDPHYYNAVVKML